MRGHDIIRKKQVPIPRKRRGGFENVIVSMGDVGGKDAFGAKVEIGAGAAFVPDTDDGLGEWRKRFSGVCRMF